MPVNFFMQLSFLPFLFHHLKKYYNAKNWLMKKEYYHNALKMLNLQLQKEEKNFELALNGNKKFAEIKEIKQRINRAKGFNAHH